MFTYAFKIFFLWSFENGSNAVFLIYNLMIMSLEDFEKALSEYSKCKIFFCHLSFSTLVWFYHFHLSTYLSIYLSALKFVWSALCLYVVLVLIYSIEKHVLCFRLASKQVLSRLFMTLIMFTKAKEHPAKKDIKNVKTGRIF